MLDGTSVVEPAVTAIVLPVTEMGLMALLKLNDTRELVPTVELLVGACDTMVGATVSVAVPAVKFNS